MQTSTIGRCHKWRDKRRSAGKEGHKRRRKRHSAGEATDGSGSDAALREATGGWKSNATLGKATSGQKSDAALGKATGGWENDVALSRQHKEGAGGDSVGGAAGKWAGDEWREQRTI